MVQTLWQCVIVVNVQKKKICFNVELEMREKEGGGLLYLCEIVNKMAAKENVIIYKGT